MISVARCDRHRERLTITLDRLGRVNYSCPVCSGWKKEAVDTQWDPKHVQSHSHLRVKRPLLPMVPCEVCRQLYQPKKGDQRYCSRDCYLTTYRNPHATQKRLTQAGSGRGNPSPAP